MKLLRLNVVEYLVENGADINGRNYSGTTALILASSEGTLSVVKYLVNKGADINAEEKYGSTPLYSASASGNFDIVKFLLEKGANINHQTKRGRTSVDISSYHGYFNIVEYLVNNGADLSIVNKYGNSALDVAKERKQTKILSFLTKASSASFKKETLLFKKAKEENTIRSYESFIASNPNSRFLNNANILVEKKYQEIKNNPRKQKKILQKILVYLEKKDVDGLLEYANNNPEVMDFAHNSPKIYLLFTGPKGLQVGKILQYKKRGLGDKMLSAKIKNLNKPYRKFSLDEMEILMSLGLSEDLIVAMIDATTNYDKEYRHKQDQINLLEKRKQIAKQNQSTTTTTNIYSTQTANSTTQNSVANKIIDKMTEKAIDSLIKKIF